MDFEWITKALAVLAIARFSDEEALLRNSGVTAVFNIYTEAGAGFAEHVQGQLRIE